MLRVVKPRNARSKRALEAREPKEVEDPRTAIFVKGTSTGETLNAVMKELMALKRPHAISFSKKNTIRPFEDTSSLEFWANKNDASMFVVAQSTKKRPDGLTFVRMYDGKVLDMCEVGVDKFVSMEQFKTKKSTMGHRPLMHFASELFDTHPRFMQLKSLLLDFFGSEVIEGIHLSGVEHVISIQLAPTPEGLNAATIDASSEDTKNLPKVHLRTYTISAVASGTKIPRIELAPMGPSLDLTLRRHQPPDPDMLKAALRRPKLKKQDIEKGLGKRKKNVEVDEMGDVRGRLHIGKQDLSKLQTKKMKGLREVESDDSESDEDDGERTEKRQKAA
ncbi:Brix-domain-containing protein [Fomitiporia mediterranea MF3/22]|uniref:Brix-domain-containing protein n=1 Tax=Fomitiporia mediterranea (strain MF3/22) TaxID=694068 RepID=UPI00044097D9|nr:Brix-domain-containing protein [Fomitiporia mediterranea MF3/22]EJD06174.1 Brix-domain-containing protein [Fomitiporia mediterranea MF3/22]